MKFKDLLAAVKEKNGLTQAQILNKLADRGISVSKRSLTNYTEGHTEPSYSDAVEILKALGGTQDIALDEGGVANNEPQRVGLLGGDEESGAGREFVGIPSVNTDEMADFEVKSHRLSRRSMDGQVLYYIEVTVQRLPKEEVEGRGES